MGSVFATHDVSKISLARHVAPRTVGTGRFFGQSLCAASNASAKSALQRTTHNNTTQRVVPARSTRSSISLSILILSQEKKNINTTMTVEDKSETSGPPGETDEEMKARKRKERLEQNRISARESRKRKKTMIEELQRTVITLSKENKELNERNETLRRQLMEIGAKVCF